MPNRPGIGTNIRRRPARTFGGRRQVILGLVEEQKYLTGETPDPESSDTGSMPGISASIQPDGLAYTNAIAARFPIL